MATDSNQSVLSKSIVRQMSNRPHSFLRTAKAWDVWTIPPKNTVKVSPRFCGPRINSDLAVRYESRSHHGKPLVFTPFREPWYLDFLHNNAVESPSRFIASR
jgi:hypothetical protein